MAGNPSNSLPRVLPNSICRSIGPISAACSLTEERPSIERRLGLFSLSAVIFQGGLHQCPSEKGAKESRLLASTSRSLVTSRLTLPANAGRLRLLPAKTAVRETRRWREEDSNPRSPQDKRRFQDSPFRLCGTSRS